MASTFWKGKSVFVTGHIGFKGAWLCRVLLLAGAEVSGYSLSELPTEPALFSLAGLKNHVRTIFGDVRDGAALARAVSDVSPDVVIHMAAQPLVRESYAGRAGGPPYPRRGRGMSSAAEILRGIALFPTAFGLSFKGRPRASGIPKRYAPTSMFLSRFPPISQ